MGSLLLRPRRLPSLHAAVASSLVVVCGAIFNATLSAAQSSDTLACLGSSGLGPCESVVDSAAADGAFQCTSGCASYLASLGEDCLVTLITDPDVGNGFNALITSCTSDDGGGDPPPAPTPDSPTPTSSSSDNPLNCLGSAGLGPCSEVVSQAADNNTPFQCTADCAAFLPSVDASCLNSIANDPDVGSAFVALIQSCEDVGPSGPTPNPRPSPSPTRQTTRAPTDPPTDAPTKAPTKAPTEAPTDAVAPTDSVTPPTSSGLAPRPGLPGSAPAPSPDFPSCVGGSQPTAFLSACQATFDEAADDNMGGTFDCTASCASYFRTIDSSCVSDLINDPTYSSGFQALLTSCGVAYPGGPPVAAPTPASDARSADVPSPAPAPSPATEPTPAPSSVGRTAMASATTCALFSLALAVVLA